jgi:hypothetical protein
MPSSRNLAFAPECRGLPPFASCFTRFSTRLWADHNGRCGGFNPDRKGGVAEFRARRPARALPRTDRRSYWGRIEVRALSLARLAGITSLGCSGATGFLEVLPLLATLRANDHRERPPRRRQFGGLNTELTQMFARISSLASHCDDMRFTRIANAASLILSGVQACAVGASFLG